MRSLRGSVGLTLLLWLAVLAMSGSSPAAECAGDECQGPPPAPAEVTPGTAIIEGPPNPPVRFPKPHAKKHHPKKHHHHRGRN